jgi:hypothetical protein
MIRRQKSRWDARRASALKRLETSHEVSKKELAAEKAKEDQKANSLHRETLHNTVERQKREIENIKKNISDGKKRKRKKHQPQEGAPKEEGRYLIDIYRVHYSYAKNSERRKRKKGGNKGKRIKRQKSLTLLKTVIAQPGMITNYKEGRVGISPKDHVFKIRKEEISMF